MKLHSILAVTLLTCATGSAIAQVEPPAEPITLPQMLPGQYRISHTLVRISGSIPSKPASTGLRGEDLRCWNPGSDGDAGLPPFMPPRAGQCHMTSGTVDGTHTSGAALCADAESHVSLTYDGDFQPTSAHVTLNAEIRFKHLPGPMSAQFDVTSTRISETCDAGTDAATNVRKAALDAAAAARRM